MVCRGEARQDAVVMSSDFRLNGAGLVHRELGRGGVTYVP